MASAPCIGATLFFLHPLHKAERPRPFEGGRVFEGASNPVPQCEVLSIVVVEEHVVICMMS